MFRRYSVQPVKSLWTHRGTNSACAYLPSSPKQQRTLMSTCSFFQGRTLLCICKLFWLPCPLLVSLSTAGTNSCCWGVAVDVLPFKTPSCPRMSLILNDGSSLSGLTSGPVAMESWWHQVCFSPASLLPGVRQGRFRTSCVACLWQAAAKLFLWVKPNRLISCR